MGVRPSPQATAIGGRSSRARWAELNPCGAGSKRISSGPVGTTAAASGGTAAPHIIRQLLQPLPCACPDTEASVDASVDA